MHFSPESKVVHTDANLELLERNLLPSGRSSLNIDPDGIPPNKLITGSAVDHVTNNQAHLTNKLDKHPNPTSHCDPISAEQALGLTRASQQHSELLEYNDTSDTLEAPQIDNGDQLDSCHCHHQLHLDAKDELRKSIEIAYCILDELVTTERSYCRSLYVFSEIVAKNMCTKSGVSLKELRLLFPRCLPDLYAMHVEMLEQMEAYMRVNDKKNGHQYEFDCSRPPFIVLLELLEQKSRKQIHTLDRTTDEEPNEARFFVLYKRYFSEFTVAMETMRKLTRQSSRFRQTVKRLQDHPDCEGFDFSAFLLAPVQRLPRYLLLMKQLTRHLRKIAQNPLRIGQTHVGTVLDMSERCEKQLHSVLVYLDSQLAEHRQNSKQKSETSVQETICGSGETGTELTSANGTQSRLNPSQLIENGYENFRSLWPRVRRAFSDKRNVATSEVSPQDESLQEQKPEQRFLSCHTATAHVEPDVVHHSQCQSYGNAVPVGRFLVAHQSEDDIFQPSDAHGTTPRSRMEKLILMDNPVQERVSCVKAGTISAAVRRNSRRQTVGEVTLAMQKAFSNNKLKRLSLDRQQLPFTQHINELSNSCVTFCDLSAEQKEPEKVMIPQSVSSVRAGSFKIAEQSRIKIDDDVKSITRKEVENPPQTEMKVNRVNTFPARQFPSLGLQRRQSEPCQAQTTQDYKKQQTIQETKLPGSQLKITAGLGKTRSVGIGSSSTFSTTSSSSTKSVPSEQTDLYRIRRRSNRLIEKSVTETARSEEIVLSRTAASAIKPSCTASKENSIGCFTCHPNVLPRDTRKPADKRSQAEVEGAVTMIKSCSKTLLGTSAPESSNTLQKKRVTSNWRSALKNLFRRKTNYKGDCSQSQVRKAQNIESSTWNSPHSVAVTPSDVGLSGTISESPSITIDTLNNLSGSMMKSDFLHTDEHIVIHESQMIADPPEIADDQKEYLSELGDLVFLDETGNPCFDI
ncbi:hypothetical protein D915_001291 [Fasciola hepatica]|uniref:DH domain-containing protein n=1 Tax=Fasciola hepatica TaxID=6192 RepID=A0A4E0RIP6_FASHE|nr:hypothetical protein D915_001291 [Fasciola hepatica]